MTIGVVNNSAVRLANTTVIAGNGEYKEVRAFPPSVQFAGDASIEGSQKVPGILRGVLQGTALDPQNIPQYHFCEPFSYPLPKNTKITLRNGIKVPNLALDSPVLRLELLLKSATLRDIVDKIRSTIENALATDALNPLITQIKAAAKYIAGILRDINNLIEAYVINALLLAQVENYIAFLINFIAKLPAIIATALAECVAAIKNAIAAALSASLGFDSQGLFTQVKILQQNIQAAQQATEQVIAGANNIAVSIENIPKGVNAGVDILTKTLSDIKNNPPKPIVNVTIF